MELTLVSWEVGDLVLRSVAGEQDWEVSVITAFITVRPSFDFVFGLSQLSPSIAALFHQVIPQLL